MAAPATAGSLRARLQALLEEKEKQLHYAGTLGQRVLEQQMELEERISQLREIDADKEDDDELAAAARERYRELSETIQSWDSENAQLSESLANKSQPNGNGNSNGHDDGPTSVAEWMQEQSADFSALGDISRDEPDRSAKAGANTTASQSRRAKNAAHRANDVEFAFEIGSGLLTEVRRLQSLLGERDKAIQDMKEEKDDLERTIESIRTALREQEQSADKYKEENWNLEVTLQELRTGLAETSETAKRFEADSKRLTKSLNQSREQADAHKTESERVQIALDELKAKHETDIATSRKHAATLQRDKQDLSHQVDDLKAELARNARRLQPGRFGSPLTPNGAPDAPHTPFGDDDDDVFSAASTNRKGPHTPAMFGAGEFGEFLDGESPDPSPTKSFLAPNHPANEMEALQQRLAHANRQIATLKSTLQREKEARINYRRQLEASPGGFVPAPGEDEEEEEEEEESTVGEVNRSKITGRKLTPFRSVRGRGRGRGRGGLTLQQRLGLAAQQQDDDEDEYGSPIPPVPSLPDSPEKDVQTSPSPPSRPTSVDGMDPVFANILRRTSLTTNSPNAPSPLRQAMAARARGGTFPRRGRGGATTRPASLVSPAEALALELGIGMQSMDQSVDQSADQSRIEEQVPEESAEEWVDDDVREWREMSCQTEEVEEKTVVVEPVAAPAPSSAVVPEVPEPVKVVTSEMGVQAEMAPVLVAPAPIISRETSSQTEVPDPAVLLTPMPGAAAVLAEEPTPTAPRVVSIVQTQTSADDEDDEVYERGRRSTITRANVPAPLSIFGGDSTITGKNARRFSEIGSDDGTPTETGEDTDTDIETAQFQDARQSWQLTTPSESNADDFHSIMTMTDNDYSDDEADRRASRLSLPLRERQAAGPTSAPATGAPPSAFSMRGARRANSTRGSTRSSRAPSVESTYENKGVAAETPAAEPTVIIKEVEVIKEVIKEVEVFIPAPKPEVRETSMQTDEWMPPPPVVMPVPRSGPASPAGLFRVGSSSQQFQFISPPPPSSAPPTLRDSPAAPVFRHHQHQRSRTSMSERSERRQSIESTISSILDPDVTPRVRTGSGTPVPVVDKTRPPMMVLPPPPRAPPPPNSMPPPSFIPDRRILQTSSSNDVPPPRPSSPPPVDLIKRATTPSLAVPGPRGYPGRQHGSSMPPGQMRQPPSTSSFRSAANAATHAQASFRRGELSTTSLGTDYASPRSSMSSEHHRHGLPPTPGTPGRNADMSASAMQGSTDPAIIHAITQTMIGEFLFKYTKRTFGKGYGENRHKRFFWVHPYTRTLYWGSADPGSAGVAESTAKSAYVESVRSVLDPNPMPPGLYQYSVIVSTPQREMKITAPTKERHDIWFNALNYLLTRPPTNTMMASPGPSMGMNGMNGMPPRSPTTDRGGMGGHDAHLMNSPESHRTGRTTTSSWNTTPKGRRSRSQMSMRGSVGKRAGTPAAEYLRWTEHEPYSPGRSFEHVPGHDDDEDEEDLDFELNDGSRSEEGFEGLENVRACCDGRHTVGRASGEHHHHDHHHHHPTERLDPPNRGDSRPKSPSGWSMRSARSRAGSTSSRDGRGLFARFGSKRSTKTVPIPGAHDR